MKTKAEIVQNLLNEGKISAEDAVVLLTEKTIVIAQDSTVTTPFPFIPNPWDNGPTYDPLNPFKVTCAVN